MMKIVACLLAVIPQLVLAQTDSNTVDSTSKNKKVYTVVEEMPMFVGGEEALLMYISTNIRYPLKAKENGVTGRVYLSFIVDDSGKVRDVKVLRGIGSGCDEEAVRVVSGMPDWIPGKQNGIPQSVYYNLPISFSISNKSKVQTSGNSTTNLYVKGQAISMTYYNDGVQYLKEGKYYSAEKKFQEALEVNNRDVDAIFNLGIARYYLGDTSGACWLWKGMTVYGDKGSTQNYEKYCSACKDSIEANTILSLETIKRIQSNSKESKKLVMPYFKLAEGKPKKYLAEKISILKSKSRKDKCKFTVTFLVASDGRIIEPSISNGSTNGNDEEVFKAFNDMPKWNSGIYDFSPVGMYQEIELSN